VEQSNKRCDDDDDDDADADAVRTLKNLYTQCCLYFVCVSHLSFFASHVGRKVEGRKGVEKNVPCLYY
jgi:hypothetical protein